jgi:dihydrofolate synthase/folylpolyglutamate synthase
LAHLGDPHNDFQCIHIAGTKGKGSVAAYCASALRVSGLKVGLYTSPHLQGFRDRIRILSPKDADGRISRQRVAELVEVIKPTAHLIPDLTWYELVTAIAFLYFEQEKVDIAVIEVGLGGRLDATTVITPLVSVITSLSLDHTYLLGDTLAEIAGEKAGIFKQGIPAISAPQPPEALEQLSQIAHSKNAPLTIIGREWDWYADPLDKTGDGNENSWQQQITVTRTPSPEFIPSHSKFSLALAGRHQQENAMVAIAALDAIRTHFSSLTLESVREGLSTVKWAGRLQILSQGNSQPTLLLDCAHNVDSAQKLVYALGHDYEVHQLLLVVGVTSDKDVSGILKILLPVTDRVILTSSTHPRAAKPEELREIATSLGYEVQISPSVADAVATAWSVSGPNDLICVTGSIFVVGDLLNQWEGLQSRLPAAKQGPIGADGRSVEPATG